MRWVSSGVLAMPKQKTIAGLREDCATALQKIVRMRAAIDRGNPVIQCVTCGVQKHWKEMHGGHFIARSYARHKLCVADVHPVIDAMYPEWVNFGNIHPQCPGCNTYKPERMADDYNLWMREWYGDDFVTWLTQTKREPIKQPRVELMELRKDLRAHARELERQCELL